MWAAPRHSPGLACRESACWALWVCHRAAGAPGVAEPHAGLAGKVRAAACPTGRQARLCCDEATRDLGRHRVDLQWTELPVSAGLWVSETVLKCQNRDYGTTIFFLSFIARCFQTQNKCFTFSCSLRSKTVGKLGQPIVLTEPTAEVQVSQGREQVRDGSPPGRGLWTGAWPRALQRLAKWPPGPRQQFWNLLETQTPGPPARLRELGWGPASRACCSSSLQRP